VFINEIIKILNSKSKSKWWKSLNKNVS
jgi:hypothetical protein